MSNGTLRQQAYRQLQHRILSGRVPSGSLVSELSLAKELGMSRSPVREAIQQLQIEGLVEQVPRRGTIVRSPQRRDIVELYELREAVESYAACRAAERIGATDLAMLDTLCREIEGIANELRQAGAESLDAPMMQRFLTADMGFHTVLIRASGNRRIMKIIGDSHVMTRIFVTRIFGTPHDLKKVNAAHRYHGRILQVVKQSDGEAARQLMIEHVRGSLQDTLQQYDRLQTQHDISRPIPLHLPKDVLAELNRIEADLDADVSEQTVAKQRTA